MNLTTRGKNTNVYYVIYLQGKTNKESMFKRMFLSALFRKVKTKSNHSLEVEGWINKLYGKIYHS